jgi:hypothetical protein
MQERQELIEGAGRSLRLDLDAAVRAVADPSAQTQLESLVLGRETEAHPLNAAAHHGVQALLPGGGGHGWICSSDAPPGSPSLEADRVSV